MDRDHGSRTTHGPARTRRTRRGARTRAAHIVYALCPEARTVWRDCIAPTMAGRRGDAPGGDHADRARMVFRPGVRRTRPMRMCSIQRAVDPQVGRWRATFTAIKGAPGGDDYHYVWIDPTNSRHLAFASDQGVGISLDGGETWSSWYNQPTAQIYHVITDDRWPYWIYGAQQDAGAVAIASRSDYGEITFRDWLPPGNGESGYIAPDPRDSTIIYGGGTVR